jgi:ABC-type multidrug transport system ATPase subunit
MSWITAFCNRAILMDKGAIIADGDPEEIADMHEEDAAKRAKQKRKAKQLLKHGKVDLVDIKKARKEGKLDDLVEGHEEEVADLKAEKQRALQESRAKKRAARLAREAEAAEAKASEAATNGADAADSSDGSAATAANAPDATDAPQTQPSGAGDRTPPSA